MTFWWWIAQHAVTTALGIVIVLAICRLVPNRPGLAHLLWAALLIKFVVPPLVAWPWLVPAFTARDVKFADFGESLQPRLESPVEEPAAAIEAPAPSVTMEHSPTIATEQASTTTGELGSTAPSPAAPSVIAPLSDLPKVDSPAAVAIIPAAPIDGQVMELPADVAPLVVVPEQASPVTAPWLKALQRVWHSGELGRLVTRGFLGIWIAGAVVLLAVQAWRIRRMTSLIKRGTAAPERLRSEVARVAEALGMRPVAVVVSATTSGPFIWCWGSARLVWPASLADDQSIRRLLGVIAHELAHVRRRDHWFAWLEMLVGIVWWFHPLCWLVRRRLHESAEMACDALAVSAAPDGRRAYAESLVALSSYGELDVVAPALGAGSRNARVIHRRLMMILSNRVTSGLTWRGWLAAAVLTIAVLPNWSLGQAPVPPAPTAKPDPAPAAETTTTETTTTETTETAPTPAESTDAAKLKVQIQQLLAERVALQAHANELQQRLQDFERVQQLLLLQKRVKPETVAAPPTTYAAAPEAADDDASRHLGRRSTRHAGDTSADSTAESIIPGERIDLMDLGLSLIDARGELSIAKEHFEQAHLSNKANPGTITQSDVRTALIRMQTAEAKLKLLQTIASAARESTGADLKAQEETIAALTRTPQRVPIPRQQMLTFEARLRGLKAKLSLIETILKD